MRVFTSLLLIVILFISVVYPFPYSLCDRKKKFTARLFGVQRNDSNTVADNVPPTTSKSPSCGPPPGPAGQRQGQRPGGDPTSGEISGGNSLGNSSPPIGIGPPGVGGPTSGFGPSPGVGGPPLGVGGGPPRSGKGGPPGAGGPPEQTAVQKALENAFEVAFSLLYLGDDSGIRDSSKNLRVLWTRALLANLGQIDDPIAYKMLPSKTKWVVGEMMAKNIWDGSPAVEKLDWIVKRTNFIDSQLEEFLATTETAGSGGPSSTNNASTRQVLVLGSGYDTRALRYQQPNLHFFEVDLPDVSSVKSSMVQHYLADKLHDEEKEEDYCPHPVHIPFDLNDVFTCNKSLLDTLQSAGFQIDTNVPTMIICEAVLFYLIPGAVQKIVAELFGLENASRFCFTDNLAKVGVAPGPPVPTPRQKCEAWLQENGKELVAHDSIWGGAIHFVGAK